MYSKSGLLESWYKININFCIGLEHSLQAISSTTACETENTRYS